MVVLRVAITDLAVLMVATPHADLAACGRQRTRSNEHASLLGRTAVQNGGGSDNSKQVASMPPRSSKATVAGLGIRERRRWCPDPAGHWRCGSGP
ncbi:hypothetical protein SORBI_3005G220250 [Sorghum bicolor]|uniref:Secreted protein n=1 Tax=Sorghum bicolor TaxID=4558 RepID=A0A1Z5RKQ6_SORBI|nr:hypothetical protein SORBI_3005G220250 [Sorghum bicolor]